MKKKKISTIYVNGIFENNCIEYVYNLTTSPYSDDCELLLDTGASCHVIGNRKLLQNIRPCNAKIRYLQGETTVKEQGDLVIGNVTIKGLLYVKGKRNIISFSRLIENKYITWKGSGNQIKFRFKNKLMLLAFRDPRKDFFFLQNANKNNKTHYVLNIEDINLNDIIMKVHQASGHVAADMTQL